VCLSSHPYDSTFFSLPNEEWSDVWLSASYCRRRLCRPLSTQRIPVHNPIVTMMANAMMNGVTSWSLWARSLESASSLLMVWYVVRGISPSVGTLPALAILEGKSS
jgi:hypothetical protein